VDLIEVTAADRAAFAGRPNDIDYSVTERLHYLGNYFRKIPSNLTRMMENAHDWEHLPFVHPSSFAGIAPVESGTWGWRCKTALPGNGGEQLIELLVDNARHYWATTVVAGAGQGTQIHTQAGNHAQGGITVDVRFYLPQAPQSEDQSAMILGYLQAQYATLYDEDEALMLGRQQALDQRRERVGEGPRVHDFGPEADLDRGRSHRFTLSTGTFVARHCDGRWLAHAATCPHMLGPLSDAAIGPDGTIACPWHGYRFALADGSEQLNRCGPLARAPDLVLSDGHLIASA
jgi:phenylpropionate dioxygenase-like ring-hydroxylating dioxygenase large terminal subunit